MIPCEDDYDGQLPAHPLLPNPVPILAMALLIIQPLATSSAHPNLSSIQPSMSSSVAGSSTAICSPFAGPTYTQSAQSTPTPTQNKLLFIQMPCIDQTTNNAQHVKGLVSYNWYLTTQRTPQPIIDALRMAPQAWYSRSQLKKMKM